MRLSFTEKNDGMTLVEVMIAMAASSIILLAMGNLMLIVSKMGATVNSRLDLLNAVSYIQAATSNQNSCFTALSGVNPSLSSIPSGPSIHTAQGATTDISIYDLTGSGIPMLSANSIFGYSKISKIQLVTDGVVPRVPLYSGDTVYTGHINFELYRPGALTTLPLAYSALYFFFELNSTNNLVTCSQAGSPRVCYVVQSPLVAQLPGTSAVATAYCNGTDVISPSTMGYNLVYSDVTGALVSSAAVTNPNGWAVQFSSGTDRRDGGLGANQFYAFATCCNF